ncbi:putative motility protein [Lysinibacillus sp. 2017]|uniref:YjfB family protein n=1 Tax=unclassified Lysinibacillus TaxID=2636778 RepID=UPI000D52967D|nr:MULTISPECIES: YjfB family protein [unclassified Lysinibacillus]AWE08194.1 putative motility protein [Lysinibacillus sp. 2017]TGN36302.1 putative motility protein [Lysinibacillus sp. S2017]
MDIAALAMSMKQAELMQNVSLAVTKQAMEFQEQSTDQLLEIIDAPHPTLGQSIDVSI